jgi:hypothetical protein
MAVDLAVFMAVDLAVDLLFLWLRKRHLSNGVFMILVLTSLYSYSYSYSYGGDRGNDGWAEEFGLDCCIRGDGGFGDGFQLE